ncbi:chromosome partitioning protein, ParB family [Desulfacinum hydrothermale DSM 13146]|uniref:Chromosome partitioning protein, ParB family n=1 Tax=Desulfacinum hydrothermale DSM 13146 TaxID=1121390 RepID=A0A1W1XEP6_9BACT|nr:ParB/Srx family N-terminal domain-containing protein [Desulfacinum hydrothermale]SMC22399.1 chromosome partitioning protein, ParB family [Desulfacinum hydrothermale DSM 13146]
MELELKRVPLEDVDLEDATFSLPGFRDDAALFQSLKAAGLIQPLVAWERSPGRFTLVDGFRRMEGLRQAGIATAPFLVHPAETPQERILKRRLEDKIFSGPLNLAEKVQIAARYAPLASEEELRRRILPALGLSSKEGAVWRWIQVGGWPPHHLELLGREVVSEKAAFLLASWKERERHAALQLLDALRCSASIQVEILERIQEVAVRDQCPLQEVFQREELAAVASSHKLNRREKTAHVRDLVARWRYPRLYRKTQTIREKIEAARLPRTVALSPPPHLEGDRWELRLTFTNLLDLDAQISWARDFGRSSQMQAIWKAFESVD